MQQPMKHADQEQEQEEGSGGSGATTLTILLTAFLTTAMCCTGYFVFAFQAEPRIWNAHRGNFNVNNTKQLSPRVAWITLGLGKGYLKSALDFVASSERFFCSDRSMEVKYFIFSNHQIADVEEAHRYQALPITILPQEKLGWPRDSDARFELIIQRWTQMQLDTFDYVFWTDADQRFVKKACEAILGERVSCMHGYFTDPRNNG
jgi:hypothetical protein